MITFGSCVCKCEIAVMLGWSTCSDSGFLNVWNYINKSQKKLLTLWSLCKYHFDPTQWRQLRRPLVRINEPQTLQRKGQFSICFGLPSYQGFVSKAVFVVSKAPMLWEQWNLKVNTPTVTCCGETHHPLAHLCFYLKAHGKNHGTQ